MSKMLKKKPDLFHNIRYLFIIITLFNKRFCHKISNWLAEENTCSYFANVANVKYILKVYWVWSKYSFLCYNHHYKGKKGKQKRFCEFLQYFVNLLLTITLFSFSLLGLSGLKNWLKILRNAYLKDNLRVSNKVLLYYISNISYNISL